MTPNDNTTSFARGQSQPHDAIARRRAYLDTYAKKRGGSSVAVPQPAQVANPVSAAPVSVQTATLQPAPYFVAEQPAVQSQPAIQPVEPVAPVRVETAVVTPVVMPVEQPSSHALGVQSQVVAPTPSMPVESPAPQVALEPAATTHKSYLDTLTRRHVAAVAQAPASEETVFEASLDQVTESLLQDTDDKAETEKRLEANLRALYDDTPLTSQLTQSTKSASAAHIRTIVASALACGILAVGMFSFIGGYDSQPVVAQPVGSPVIEVEAPVKQPTGGTPVQKPVTRTAPNADPTHPVRLVISSIGVNAPVEGLGTTADGLIAVPKSYGVVGWYNKGSLPGKPGPAVLVGHYTGGNGGVFDRLQDLNNGDLITTTNGRGESVTFRVTAKNEYDRDKVPMAELFKSSNESKLQIITCAGKWQSKNYDKRLVVTAEIVR